MGSKISASVQAKRQAKDLTRRFSNIKNRTRANLAGGTGTARGLLQRTASLGGAADGQ